MNLEKEISDLGQLPSVAKELLDTFKGYSIFLFQGEMGSGKTTFIKELCKELGSTNNFSSPTYSIVNEYKIPTKKIFHFDLYRLKSTDELFDIGFEDYLSQNAFIFIEWPLLCMDFIKNEKFVQISIKHHSDKRTILASSN